MPNENVAPEADPYKLLPCPFCDGEAETGFEDSHNGGHVRCTQCGVIGPVWANDTLEAVVGWNKRHLGYMRLPDGVDAMLPERSK
ncbi:MAG: Restriction alleviation protein Lar [Devosia sp.]|uniref:Lar family restriction alleviation protein n=1 Tax=Devosia sp. TaxID=1871048 RepID=UPI002A42F5B9|nr:Restriction alleviation protein Lar [Devosia sp.]